eukprot:5675854-Pleurochrysis_carterae.AAC.1
MGPLLHFASVDLHAWSCSRWRCSACINADMRLPRSTLSRRALCELPEESALCDVEGSEELSRATQPAGHQQRALEHLSPLDRSGTVRAADERRARVHVAAQLDLVQRERPLLILLLVIRGYDVERDRNLRVIFELGHVGVIRPLQVQLPWLMDLLEPRKSHPDLVHDCALKERDRHLEHLPAPVEVVQRVEGEEDSLALAFGVLHLEHEGPVRILHGCRFDKLAAERDLAADIVLVVGDVIATRRVRLRNHHDQRECHTKGTDKEDLHSHACKAIPLCDHQEGNDERDSQKHRLRSLERISQCFRLRWSTQSIAN